LTVGTTVYTRDDRVTLRHHARSHVDGDVEDWILIISSARVEDSGVYECQINTEPKRSKSFDLSVVGEDEDSSG